MSDPWIGRSPSMELLSQPDSLSMWEPDRDVLKFLWTTFREHPAGIPLFHHSTTTERRGD